MRVRFVALLGVWSLTGCVERIIFEHAQLDGDSNSGGEIEVDTTGAPLEEPGLCEDVLGETDNFDDAEVCAAPQNLTPCDLTTADPFEAMGLGCPWGPDSAISIQNTAFTSPDPRAWRVITQYGTHINPADGLPTWRPREGNSMLALSTGTLPLPDAQGRLTQEPSNGGSNDNPDEVALPAPIVTEHGSNLGEGGAPFEDCDGVGDCSDSLRDQWQAGLAEANDLLWLQFETQAPAGTYGFSFDFAFFSAEFPEYVGSEFNDIFVAWSSSESYTGNLCFVNDQPCTVTALWPPQFTEGNPALDGTLFEPGEGEDDGLPGTSGEATGWFEARGSAIPGEFVQLTFAVFDMGDTIFDTLVLLDNFRWHCECCTAPDFEPCIGIEPV
ncbi:MAG: choice-of-anchor L domain-containing protein [Myxococcota bacterium]